MSKGSNWERDLANILDEAGWGVLRCGGSGGGTTDDRPDLIAGNSDRLWVIEAKYRSDTSIYLEEQEIDQINTLADSFQGIPVIAARWDSRSNPEAEPDWYLFRPEVVPRTDSGKYAVRTAQIGNATRLATALKHGETL